jgi:hypothetical protein
MGDSRFLDAGKELFHVLGHDRFVLLLERTFTVVVVKARQECANAGW